MPSGNDRILAWKSKGLSEESGKPDISDTSLAFKLTFIHNAKIAAKFEGSCFKQEKISFLS